MVALPRASLIVLFVSVLAGFAAGAWSRDVWNNSVIGIVATVFTIVTVYTVLAFLLARAGIHVE